MSQIKPIARKSDIVVQELTGETLVYDLNTNKALALNQTSALVWRYCNGDHTVTDISKMMTVRLKEFVSEDLVWFSLEQLKKEHLIETESFQLTPFRGLSRREMIRKIGLASAVALPVIVSVLAPSAVSAGSCAALNNNAMLNFVGCSCQSNNDCQNTCCGAGTMCATPDSVPNSSACRVNCECISMCCGGAFFGCVTMNSAAMGDPCGSDCQCAGASSCLASMLCS